MESSVKRRAVDSHSPSAAPSSFSPPPFPSWSLNSGVHVIRMCCGPNAERLELKSSSVQAVGSQGVFLVFEPAPAQAIMLPISELELFVVDDKKEGNKEKCLLNGGKVSLRKHDDGDCWTTHDGQFKVLFNEQHVMTQIHCVLHGLSYTDINLQPKYVVPSGRFEGWTLLVSLRTDTHLLFERHLQLRVSEIGSEALMTVCFAPEDFVGQQISRASIVGGADRLKLVADWTLWTPLPIQQLVCFQTCFLWTQRNRQFPTVYKKKKKKDHVCMQQPSPSTLP